MRSGGQTTVIQRILEKRAQKPPEIQEDTSATTAIMLRVLPPPRTLLVFEYPALPDHLESTITADVLDGEAVADELEAVRLFGSQFYPVIITDNLELIRKVRARQTDRAPYILYNAGLDEGLH